MERNKSFIQFMLKCHETFQDIKESSIEMILLPIGMMLESSLREILTEKIVLPKSLHYINDISDGVGAEIQGGITKLLSHSVNIRDSNGTSQSHGLKRGYIGGAEKGGHEQGPGFLVKTGNMLFGYESEEYNVI